MNIEAYLFYLITTSTDEGFDYLDLKRIDLRPGWNFPRTSFATKTYKDSGYLLVIL